MSEACDCPPDAGNAVCDLPAKDFQRPAWIACPECGKTGKLVQGQTAKALLSISLREIQDTQYLFCRTETCAVVYFSADGKQTFTVEEIRERVYQKEPAADDVLLCYCFRYTVGDLRSASHEGRLAIIDDINAGINAGQCACDLRNPQGSCCLGNVRAMIIRLDESAIAPLKG
jgi:hypothetical protein